MKHAISKTLWLITAIAVLSSGVGPLHAQENRVATMPARHATLFRKHCFECHDSDSEEAGVNLETISFDISRDMETAGLWQKVLGAINSGEMPPEDVPPIPNAMK
ncbi:MAG: c-type cytochrome domain-containing protein, partial [Planctomycetota bacterium]